MGRDPAALAEACRAVARELRTRDGAEYQIPAFREGRAHLLEEAAAMLEAPGVLANLRRLRLILGAVEP